MQYSKEQKALILSAVEQIIDPSINCLGTELIGRFSSYDILTMAGIDPAQIKMITLSQALDDLKTNYNIDIEQETGE